MPPAPGSLLCRLDAVPQGACKELRYGEGDASFALLLSSSGAEIHAYVTVCSALRSAVERPRR